MKKLSLFLAVSTIATLGFSQSKLMLDANLSFGTTSGNKTTTTGSSTTTTPNPSYLNFGMNVDAAYLITKNFAAGLGLGFDVDSRTETTAGPNLHEDSYTTSMFIIRPQAHLFLPLNDMIVFAPSLYFSVGFGGTSVKEVRGSTVTTTTKDKVGFRTQLEPLGVDFKLTKLLTLHLSAGSIYFQSGFDSLKDAVGGETKNTENTFNFSLNPSINVGLRLFF